MSVATPSITTSEQPVIVSTDVIWRLSVDQYHAMIQAGILTEDDPVELLEGWLVTKMSKKILDFMKLTIGLQIFLRVLLMNQVKL